MTILIFYDRIIVIDGMYEMSVIEVNEDERVEKVILEKPQLMLLDLSMVRV